MKYENFEKVKTLVREIKRLEEMMQEIQESARCLVIKGNDEDLCTVDLEEGKYTILVELASDYIIKVVQYCSTEINKLKNEIEQC